MDTTSKQTLHSTESSQQASSFRDELMRSRMNLNETFKINKIPTKISNTIINQNHDENDLPLGLQVFVLPGDEYFNSNSNLDYTINLTVDDQNDQSIDTSSSTSIKNTATNIEITVDYKFPQL
jgi:hypothetical protein